jgi:N-hydroxyarylamine O-acetyltransferase
MTSSNSAAHDAEQVVGVPAGTAYWARIGYSGPLEPTMEVLQAICRAHVQAVPFETLDGPEGLYPALDLVTIQHKIVNRRSGGACLELNGLLAHYLIELGFQVDIFAAYVWLPREDRFTDNTDHLLLAVSLDGERWLVDVGYSHLTQVEPIRFAVGETRQGAWTFRLSPDAHGGYLLERGDQRGDRVTLYRFVPEPTTLDDFERVVKHYLTPGATTPVSRAVMCARNIPGGKITLINDQITVARDGVQTVRQVTDAETCERVMREIFDGHDHLTVRGMRLWREFSARAHAEQQSLEGDRT